MKKFLKKLDFDRKVFSTHLVDSDDLTGFNFFLLGLYHRDTGSHHATEIARMSLKILEKVDVFQIKHR